MSVSAQGRLLAGRYRRIRRLGSGGMASVFLAEDERLGRRVAVKRLHADSPEDVAARFRREAQLGASLNHPSIVAVYDIDTDDEGVLIVMEYVEGPTLRDVLRAGPLEPARAIAVLRDVAAALDHAHASGVVHRDVKPGNVLIRRDGGAKLADLGIATAAERTRITRSGTVLGTAAYMPPERLDGHAGDHRADIYSLAAVAYEVLTGRKAIEGATPVEVAPRVATNPPPDLREAWRDAPAGASDVIRRGLAKDPEKRPASAGELIDELAGALSGAHRETAARGARRQPEAARPAAAADAPPPAPPRRQAVGPWRFRDRSPLPLALAALAALAVAAIVALSAGGGGESASERVGGQQPDGGQPDRGAGGQGGSEKPGGQGDEVPGGGSQAPTPAPGSGAGDPSTPDGAFQAFYQRAAADDYEGAWELASPRFRSQLRGFDAFQSQQSTLRSISFPKLQVKQQAGDSATVRFESAPVHTTGAERCKGQGRLVRSGEGWLVDGLDAVSCKPA